jgi:hypothetical protein
MRQIKIRIVERTEAVLFLGLFSMFFCMTYARYGYWCFLIVVAVILGSVAWRDTIRLNRRKAEQASEKTGGKQPAGKRQDGRAAFFHIAATFAAGILLLYRWASSDLAHYWYPTVLAVVAVMTSLLCTPDLDKILKKRRRETLDLDRFGTAAIFVAWGGAATLACLGLTGNLWHYWYVTVPVAPATVAAIIVAPDMDSPVPQ